MCSKKYIWIYPLLLIFLSDAFYSPCIDLSFIYTRPIIPMDWAEVYIKRSSRDDISPFRGNRIKIARTVCINKLICRVGISTI